MSTTLERPLDTAVLERPLERPVVRARERDRPPIRIAVSRRRARRRPRADLLLPWIIAAIALIVGCINIAGAPDLQDDEGTYTAQALAILDGRFAPYTYWYDHPPFGWAQLAPLLGLADALGLDSGGAVIAGRYAILPFFAASAALVWIITRRVGGGAVAASAASAAFVFSPLALGYGRMVFLDNIATSWMLLALALALSPRRWMFSHASAGAALAVAALSKLTILTTGPAVLVAMIARPTWRTRRFSVAAFFAVGAAVALFFPLLAMLRGELIAGPGHVSLEDGLIFQLASRGGSGSIFDAGSARSELLASWVSADPVLILAGAGATALCLFSRRTWWIVVALACWALPVVAGNGYIPSMYVVSALPLLAIAIGAAIGFTGRLLARVRPWIRSPWPEIVPALIVAALVASSATAPLSAMLTEDRNADARAAEQWVSENIPRDDVVVVPYSLWPDLHRAGWDDPWTLIVAEKIDLDSQFEVEHPDGWRAIDWVVVGPTLRSNIDSLGLERVGTVVDHGEPVYESGGWQVLRVMHGPPQSAGASGLAD